MPERPDLGARARKLRERGRLAARPRDPRALETAYRVALQRHNAALVAASRSALDPILDRAKKAETNRRIDADPDDFAEISWSALRARFGRIDSRAARIVDQFGRRIREFNSADLSRILKIDVAADTPAVKAILDAWRLENIGLIRSISTRLLDDLEAEVSAATRRGTRVETLAASIRGRYGVSKSRAALIARDQVLKANSDLTRARHEDAGITQYVWSTSRDERVRDMHSELEGRVFSWDDPPVTNPRGDRNHPGRDFSCRCVAIPVLDSPA